MKAHNDIFDANDFQKNFNLITIRACVCVRLWMLTVVTTITDAIAIVIIIIATVAVAAVVIGNINTNVIAG